MNLFTRTLEIEAKKKIILLAGASGYIGKNVFNELTRLGHQVISIGRSHSLKKIKPNKMHNLNFIELDDIEKFQEKCPKFDILISCIGSRTGGIKDAWSVDYKVNKYLLKLGISKCIDQFILLSAICVQKPRVEFQFAKLAFEKLLIESGLSYTIIRPTAFFKSLSGQISKVKNGKPFIYFDNGRSTSCKPISEKDLAHYICASIGNKTKLNQILPIGGRGPALTPLQIGNMIFNLVDQKPKFRNLPSKLFKTADQIISPIAFFSDRVKNTQQFLRIANYYATESMLFFNEKTKCYDEYLTPEYGQETLESHFKKLISSDRIDDELGAHKLF